MTRSQPSGGLGEVLGRGLRSEQGPIGQSPAAVVALPVSGLPTRRLDHYSPQFTRQVRHA